MPFPEFQWRAMTAAINQIKPPPRLLQDLVFRTRKTNAAEVVDVDVVVGGQRVLPFVSNDAGGTVVNKLGRKVASVKCPRIRPKVPFSAPELLNVRGPGANFYGSGADISRYRKERLAQELKGLKDASTRTIELMCAKALSGKLEVRQDDLEFDVDYQIQSSHKPTASPLWDGTSPDIMGDIEAWVDLLEGAGPIVAIMGKDAWAAMRKDTTVMDALDNRRVEAGKLVLDAANTYKGDLNGVALYRYTEKYETIVGVDGGPYIPDNVFILVATGARFSVEFGQILDLEAEAQVVAEFFSKSWMEKDPSALWILAETRPLPVPWEPDAIVYATVTS